MTFANVHDFRDAVDDLFDATRSLQSARDDERSPEAVRLQRLVSQLRDATWPKRLSPADRSRGCLAIDKANAAITSAIRADEGVSQAQGASR